MSSTLYLYGSVNRCPVQPCPEIYIGRSLEMSQRFKASQSIAGTIDIRISGGIVVKAWGAPTVRTRFKKNPPPSRGGDGRPIAKGGEMDTINKWLCRTSVSFA